MATKKESNKESKDNLITALIKARKEIGAIKKTNKGYGYHYAPLDEVIAAIIDPLTNNNLMITQEIFTGEDNIDYLKTTLYHTSGESIVSGLKIPSLQDQQNKKQNELQAFGGAVTYLRRYSLLSLLFLATEDDDAQSAQNIKRNPDKHAPPSTEQQPRYLSENEIKQIRDELKGDQSIALFILKHYQVNAWGHIPAEELPKIINTIRKYHRQEQGQQMNG